MASQRPESSAESVGSVSGPERIIKVMAFGANFSPFGVRTDQLGHFARLSEMGKVTEKLQSPDWFGIQTLSWAVASKGITEDTLLSENQCS